MAAFFVTVLSGNTEPSCELKDILTIAGIKTADNHLKNVIDDLKGKNIEEVVESGNFFANIPVTFYKLLVLTLFLGISINKPVSNL